MTCTDTPISPSTAPKPETALGFKVAEVEAKYSARYVGIYDIHASGNSMAVFWVDNPDRSLGHDNYFGLFIRYGLDGDPGIPYITSAAKLRDIEFPAIEVAPGEFLVSRGRHDYVTHPCGAMLDGGGAGYTRYNPAFPPTHNMRVVDGYEVFTAVARDDAPVAAKTDKPVALQDLAVVTARVQAVRLHGEQKYAGQPYVHHLDAVAQVLVDAGYSQPLWLKAAYFHDVIEDCLQDHDADWRRAHVRGLIGVESSNLVWAVTGIGPNRKARNADIYKKLGETTQACVLKAADRIANLEASIKDPATGEPNVGMAKMYLKEEAKFMSVVGDHINRYLAERLYFAFKRLKEIVALDAEASAE